MVRAERSDVRHKRYILWRAGGQVAKYAEVAHNMRLEEKGRHYPDIHHSSRMKERILSKAIRIVHISISSLLTVLLAVFLFPFGAQSAYATGSTMNIDDAQAAFDSSEEALQYAKERLKSITDEFDQLSSEIDQLQSQIDELSVQVLDAQEAMLEGRTSLSNTVIQDYRNGSTSALLGVLLGSTDWVTFTRNVDYVGDIIDHQTEEIATQKELKDQFTASSEKLTVQKNEQEAKLQELNQKREEASSVVDQAAAELQENSAELENLRKQASSFIWKGKEGTPYVDPDANTTDRDPVVSDKQPVIPDTGNNNNGGNGNTSSDQGWKTGIASAYGGSSDPNTPNPGTTANGSVCNDTSTGVAIPLAWGDAEWARLKGRTVEIKYNGMTVYGVVNDRGGMGGGSRALDLQPGIFKAFGYSTCMAWGLRTVSYRFL